MSTREPVEFDAIPTEQQSSLPGIERYAVAMEYAAEQTSEQAALHTPDAILGAQIIGSLKHAGLLPKVWDEARQVLADAGLLDTYRILGIEPFAQTIEEALEHSRIAVVPRDHSSYLQRFHRVKGFFNAFSGRGHIAVMGDDHFAAIEQILSGHAPADNIDLEPADRLKKLITSGRFGDAIDTSQHESAHALSAAGKDGPTVIRAWLTLRTNDTSSLKEAFGWYVSGFDELVRTLTAWKNDHPEATRDPTEVAISSICKGYGFSIGEFRQALTNVQELAALIELASLKKSGQDCFDISELAARIAGNRLGFQEKEGVFPDIERAKRSLMADAGITTEELHAAMNIPRAMNQIERDQTLILVNELVEQTLATGIRRSLNAFQRKDAASNVRSHISIPGTEQIHIDPHDGIRYPIPEGFVPISIAPAEQLSILREGSEVNSALRRSDELRIDAAELIYEYLKPQLRQSARSAIVDAMLGVEIIRFPPASNRLVHLPVHGLDGYDFQRTMREAMHHTPGSDQEHGRSHDVGFLRLPLPGDMVVSTAAAQQSVLCCRTITG